MCRKSLTIILNIFNSLALIAAAVGLLFGIVKYLNILYYFYVFSVSYIDIILFMWYHKDDRRSGRLIEYAKHKLSHVAAKRNVYIAVI